MVCTVSRLLAEGQHAWNLKIYRDRGLAFQFGSLTNQECKRTCQHNTFLANLFVPADQGLTAPQAERDRSKAPELTVRPPFLEKPPGP